MLAGLTQAELLKLSPELGVCVGGLEDEQEEVQEFRLQDKDKKLEETGTRKTDEESDAVEEVRIKEESKEKHRTTTFTEMARRRKKTSDLYYQTPVSNIHETVSRNSNTKAFRYSSELADSPPPPPPPRPLPPIPPSLPAGKVSTLPANSKQPERFDWLIAFTPECEAPTHQTRSHVDTPKKSSSSGSSPGSAPKVTTFKELRFRNKNASPPTKLITEPDPDPTVITPDPDILYNLKWRKEKAGSDGSQWEYTSQAQALFMQPPPALTSMAALQEMLQRADKEGGQLELCPSPKIGFSVSDSNLLTTGRQKEVQHEDKEGKEERRKELEVRGRADGGRTIESRTSAVRSVSFGGSVQKAEALWMGEDVKYLLRGDLSSQCLQEKKALVSAVSVAVEAILAQFSSSRTVVQKTLSGDSTINPSLGRLVLQCLCPALHSLLIDGLKPHQSDLIAGRRPNSAWSLVNATTRPAPKTQALYNLQVRVSELPQLKQSKHRFNAFILGLLNIKHLDFWLSHLQSRSDVLETYYYPTSFMRLSVTACQPLFKELLLVLQPLSLLTFNVDLLFQHHHVEADGHRPQIPPVREDGFQPSAQSQSNTRSYRHMGSLSGVDFGSPETKDTKSSSLADVENTESGTSVEASHTSPQLLWVQKKEIEDLPPPNIDEDSFTQQAGQVIQQGWGAMMRWGGKLSQNLADLNLSSVKKEEMNADLPDVQAGGDYTPVSGGAQVPWGLGRLFGASKSPNSPTGHTVPTRRPSQWLAPGVTAFTRMVSSSSTPMLRRTPEPLEEREPTPEKDADTQERQDKPRPLRSVRALCDHTGNGSELSFCKGEELVVLGGVDQDWIRCQQGDREGLVPIGYTSLIM